ncbi:MAG: ATP-binding protein [Psychrilyobacter sp.]|uniref:ATP-binding protein n=1 Tax=Psychrilyobacter sp. TaxID=2586924 RepID=UPI003C75C8C0
MKLKRDSLLFKTILYNDLSMLLTGLTIIGLVVIFVFKELEKNFSIKAVEKFQVVEDMLDIRNAEFINELTKLTNFKEFVEEDIFIDSIRTMEENKEIYENMKKELISKNFSLYHESRLTIIGKNGSILDVNGMHSEINNKFIKNLRIIRNKLSMTIDSVMYDELEERFYYEIVIPVEENKEIYAVLVEVPLEKDYFKGNKYLIVADHDDVEDIGLYRTREPLSLNAMELNRLKKEKPKLIKLNGKKYNVKSLILKGIDYNIISRPVLNSLGSEVGYLVLSLAEPALTKFKRGTMSLIILATIFLILLNSFIINGTFKQLLMPLEELSLAVDDIASGNLDRNVRLNGTSEIKILSLATKKMVEKLKNSNFILEDQNEKLKAYIHRVEGVEKLLLGVRKEPSDKGIIDLILKGFTSGVGLNYDRAIFFEYSNEHGCLVGSKIRKNRNIVKEDKLSSFDLRYETMKEIVPLIKIKNDDNLFHKAILEKKIIFENRRGYKIYLGSELLMGFGLSNFMILPIFNGEKNVGCILIDNYISGRRIELEDVELFNVILLNVGIHYENQQIGLEKITNERDIAIGRMFKKIIYRRNKVIEKYTLMMMKLYKNDQINSDAFKEFRDEICNINREDSILFDYSDKKEYNFEKLKINKFLTEVVESYVRCNPNRDISLFLGEEATFLGDSIELTKACREIINNALNAISGVTNGRINIISKITNESIKIKILDNGSGISAKALGENLFEPFASGSEESSGLGLAIANKIISSHRGIIKIKSELGEGAEIKIILNRYKEDMNV